MRTEASSDLLIVTCLAQYLTCLGLDILYLTNLFALLHPSHVLACLHFIVSSCHGQPSLSAQSKALGLSKAG